MIERVEIKNFKSICQMELELGSINVFIGANGAGKSNILEAFGIISSAVFGLIDTESLQRRGIRLAIPELYANVLQNYQSNENIFFYVEGAGCHYKVILERPNSTFNWRYNYEEFQSAGNGVISRDNESVNPDSGIIPMYLNKFSQQESLFNFFKSLREYAIYTPVTRKLQELSLRQQNRFPVGLFGEGISNGFRLLKEESKTDEELSEYIAETISLFNWIKDIDVLPIQGVSELNQEQATILTFTDKYMKSNFPLLTSNISEGVLYALFLMILAFSKDSPLFFALDNIEQSLNPRLLRAILELLQEWFMDVERNKNKQILLTTHNPVVLDSLKFNDDRVRIFVVERDSTGATIVNPIIVTRELIEISQEKKLPLSQLWLEGFLGGIPNV